MDSIERITKAFETAKSRNRAALMPYFTLGYPTINDSIAIVKKIAQSGADLIELGVPFSDPLADGPTIQQSSQIALEGGVSVSRCLAMVKELREQGIQQPLLLMGYYNPILAFGVEEFVREAKNAGADGFIVPDLPPEEAAEMERHCKLNGMALVFLLAPTSTEARIKLIVSKSTGFIYLVSVLGVTGARSQLPVELSEFVNRVRVATDKPLAVGFGISSSDQAVSIGNIADGVIIGSALINAVDKNQNREMAAASFINDIRVALSDKR